MGLYTCHAYDFSSRAYIGALPLENLTFGRQLGGVGTLQGDVPLWAEQLNPVEVRRASLPYRTKLFVERGDQLVWGGWIHEEPQYDSDSGRLVVTAEETLGYFARRFLPTVTYTQVDQLAIARALIVALQAEPGGDMWVTLDDAVMSGVLRDRTYNRFDKSPSLTGLTQLSEVENGFEIGMQVIWDGAHQPQETLMLGYPRLGRVRGASGLVWEYDKFMPSEQTIESFTWAPSISMATRCWADTETDEGVQLTAVSERSDLIALGYPLMEHSETYEGIQSFTTLQAHADALQEARSAPRIVATARAKAQSRMELGDFFTGDDVLARIADHRFPPGPNGEPGFIGYLRIVGYDVAADPETYTISLGDITTWA